MSCGDPFTLGDRRLEALLRDLESIPHVCRVRVHKRLPIVLPERIDVGFLAAWDTDVRRLVRQVAGADSRTMLPPASR